jgi:hypothetical protein
VPGLPFCPTCGGDGYIVEGHRTFMGILTSGWIRKTQRPCWCARYSSTVPAGKIVHWMDEEGDGPGTLTYAVKRLLIEADLVPVDVERIKWYFGQWMNVAFPPLLETMWWQKTLAIANDNESLFRFYRVAKSEGVDPLFLQRAPE